MPSHSQLPGEIKRSKLIKALKRLGFVINTYGGDGSHIKIVWPSTQKSITIPDKIHKQTLSYIIKEIEKYSEIMWEEIKKNL